jgi:transcriptional regulator with XRE-family HTH domain
MEGARLVTMSSESEFGRYLAMLRRETGKSQRRLAELLCEVSGRDTVTRHEVSRWERGERVPTSWLPNLAMVLGLPLDRLERVLATSIRDSNDISESSPQPTLSDLLPQTSAWQPSATGRRIGKEAAENLAARAHGLRLADDVIPSHDLVAPAFRELRAAVRLFRETSHSEETGRALLGIIGELAQITGWIASDAGQHQQAEEIYRLGLSAARQAGDQSLVANLAGSLAYQHANTGREAEAINLARAAHHEAENAHPVVQALSLDRVAWATTKTGDAETAVRALSDAHEAIARPAPQDPPDWVYWVSDDELGIMDARVYTELQRPLRAVPLLTKILDRYDATHTRELALYLSWLAVALTDANEPEEAAKTASRMLDLAQDFPSERTAERGRVVLTKLEPYRTDVPEVRDLFDRHSAAQDQRRLIGEKSFARRRGPDDGASEMTRRVSRTVGRPIGAAVGTGAHAACP